MGATELCCFRGKPTSKIRKNISFNLDQLGKGIDFGKNK